MSLDQPVHLIHGKRARKAVDRDSIDVIVSSKRSRGGHASRVIDTRSAKTPSVHIQNYSMITLSRLDKAPQLELSEDQLECLGCLVSSTHINTYLLV
jgi:hypothetical protein